MSPSIALAQSLVSVGIMLLIWTIPGGRLRRDSFRSRVRRIRDELFDFMIQHDYEFSLPAYCDTRQVLNGMIRCSNYFSVLTFFHSFWLGLRSYESESSVREHIDELQDERLKAALSSALNRATREMIGFIFLRSLFGLACIPVMLVVCLVATLLKRTSGAIREVLVDRPSVRLQQEAYMFGTRHNGLAIDR